MRADRCSMSEDDDDDESRKRAASTPDPVGSSTRPLQRPSHSGWGCDATSAAAAAPSATSAPPPDQVLENVLENVLHFLTCRRDRNAASLVCRSWYRAEAQTRTELFIGNCYAVSPLRAIERFPNTRSVALKGRPRFADFSLVPEGWGGYFGAWATAMAPAYQNLEKIHLKRMTIADDDLILVARSFPGFKELVITCCDGFSTYGIAAIAHYCRQLRVLDLIEAEVEDDGTDWIPKFPEKATCLESLIFDCVECPVDFDDLEALVARSPSLKRLRVNLAINIRQLSRLMARAPQLTDLGTGSFLPSPAEQQQMGDDEDVEQMAEISAAFSASKSIVGLSGFRATTFEYLPAIYPVCANLVTLNFSFAELTLERFKPVISRCHNLRTLWVLDLVRDEGLQAVAATCSNLRELRVFPAEATEDTDSPVSDVGLTAISEGCRKLRSILYFCQYMTNASVIAMSKNCSELVVFRLCIMGRRKPDHVTGEPMDEGFGAIVMNCKKLTRLAISGLLTDKAFAYIGKYGKLVRTLSVAFAGDSDHGLRYVLQGCPKLQKLEIRDSPFGDPGLLSGLHQYYNMRFLWMSSCKLTLKGCKDVARRLPNLVVEVIRDPATYSEKKTKVEEQDDSEPVGAMYLYRSLSGPRADAPPFVQIL